MPGAVDTTLFRAGEQLSASKLNDAVARRQSLVPGSFQSGAYDVARRLLGFDDTTLKTITNLAVVRSEAGASTWLPDTFGLVFGTIGTCELLVVTGQPMGVVNVGDPPGSQYIEFASLHPVKCAVGRLLILHATGEIKPGSLFGLAEDTEPGATVPNHIVLGELANAADYLWELPGRASMTLLGIEANDDDAEPSSVIKWIPHSECVTPP